MMKILAAFALIVAASAVDSRPVITLDLASEMASKAQICEYEQEWLAMVCGTAPGDPSCSSTNGVHTTGGSAIKHMKEHPLNCKGQQGLLVKRCEVFSNPKTCAEPKAHAQDHHEEDVTDKVVTRYMLNVESLPKTYPPTKVQVTRKKLDYDTRGEFIIEYSVTDESGNKAENAHFIMIFNDTTAPAWKGNAGNDQTLTYEANQVGKGPYSNRYEFPFLGSKYDVTDNYDGKVNEQLKVTVKKSNNAGSQYAFDFQKGSKPQGRFLSDACYGKTNGNKCKFDLTYSYEDYASIFGTNHQNNKASKTVSISIKDTTKPRIFCHKSKRTPSYKTCTITKNGRDITCNNAANPEKGQCKFNLNDESSFPYVECNDKHQKNKGANYETLAEKADFGAVAIDEYDNIKCTKSFKGQPKCNVQAGTTVASSYAFQAGSSGTAAKVVATYEAKDANKRKTVVTRDILFQYNDYDHNHLYCNHQSIDFFLELWSRGFDVKKTCNFDVVDETTSGAALKGNHGPGNKFGIDGKLSKSEIPSQCKVTFRHHATNRANQMRDNNCWDARFKGTVISFGKLKQ
eukprot:g1334.t1